MSEYSDAADALLNNLAEAGPVEEYQIGNRRVRRGSPLEQVKAAAMLRGLAARTGGIFHVAKFTEPTDTDS